MQKHIRVPLHCKAQNGAETFISFLEPPSVVVDQESCISNHARQRFLAHYPRNYTLLLFSPPKQLIIKYT